MGWEGGLKLCHVFAGRLFFVSRQKISCSFLKMEGVGGHLIGFVDVINVSLLNGSKLQPIQLLKSVFSSSTSSQKHFECHGEHPSFPHPTDDLNQPKGLLFSFGT